MDGGGGSTGGLGGWAQDVARVELSGTAGWTFSDGVNVGTLDETGNSVRAQKGIADISNALGGNPLASKPR